MENKPPKETQREHEYNVGKMTFVVSPVYREDSGKTIHDLILNLMKKDTENH